MCKTQQETLSVKRPPTPPNLYIICTHSIGFDGMRAILETEYEALSQRFIPAFLKRFANGERQSRKEEMHLAAQEEAFYIQELGSNGIFAGLWELGETLRTGLEVEMHDLPLLQETIECCEFLHVNPYQLDSSGCLLIVAKQGQDLCEKLGEIGSAAVIGRTMASNDRVCIKNGERRFLNRTD